MEVRVYEIPRPGRYILQTRGLGPAQERDAEHRLVFARPHLAQSIGYTVVITLSGVAFIASLVFFLLRVMEEGGGT